MPNKWAGGGGGTFITWMELMLGCRISNKLNLDRDICSNKTKSSGITCDENKKKIKALIDLKIFSVSDFLFWAIELFRRNENDPKFRKPHLSCKLVYEVPYSWVKTSPLNQKCSKDSIWADLFLTGNIKGHVE